ncbi:unnamed protein product, partial [Mesorhabditis belari]|uniref:C-type lectin domain-containing protein n=1 Tax=Mesorhabditis belari TaxID=2138241 RepID=A0AAF3J9E1_9BILA
MGIPWRLICVFGFFSCVSTDNECLKCSDLPGFTEIQGSCYAPIVAKANRGDAIKECQKLHPKATLGTIRSAAQNAAVHDLAVNKLRAQCSSFSGEVWKNQMWIGFWDDLKDAKLANTWENDVKSDYRNWAPGQPKDDSGEEKGTAMTIVSGGPDPDGSWYDLHSQESVICGALCEILPIYVNGNQAEAKTQCKKLHPDADLASIRCDAENEGIWKLSQGSFKDRCATHDPTNKYLDQLIIGKSNGDWIDCTNTTYSNWNAGEPNNAGGNEPVSTLFITNESPQFPKGKWNDLADGKFCAAMCELLVGTTGNSCGLKPCPGTQTCAASSGSSSGSPTPAPKVSLSKYINK